MASHIAYTSTLEYTESLHRYQPGGYHPVHVGDIYDNGRYKVTHKLGSGGFSTVWLAHDTVASRLVALKILVAAADPDSQEVRTLRVISHSAHDHPGKRHISNLLDEFALESRNGTHKCLVLEVEGDSVEEYVYATKRLSAKQAWTISKQITLVLDHLHTLRICHGGELYVEIMIFKR
jgi:serine/threonine-protein kinase SRPK3